MLSVSDVIKGRQYTEGVAAWHSFSSIYSKATVKDRRNLIGPDFVNF